VPETRTPAAFISYSRADSEFALRLAQDLKAAGAAVWIDQLDIAAGQLWDNAIEDALIASPSVLLVLSPGSAHSNNVRNEISFALEQGKTVIPVLYQDCTVPLQLQRANRVDFRADYSHGLAMLLSSLQVAHPDPEVLHDAAEAEAKRKAAWQAREAEARRLQQLEESKPPEPHPEPSRQSAPIVPPPQAYVASTPPQPAASASRPWLKFAILGAIGGVIILAVVLRVGQSTNQGAAAPAAAPIRTDQYQANQPNAAPRRKPGAGEAGGYSACVFAPVSHIRVEPAAKSDIAQTPSIAARPPGGPPTSAEHPATSPTTRSTSRPSAPPQPTNEIFAALDQIYHCYRAK
jgi:hypothetical protein